MNEIKKLILEQISHNSRITNTDLAKAINKPRHVVSYHREQLYKQNIVLGGELLLDFEALGYQEAIIYLSVLQYGKIRDELIDFVLNHPNSKYASEIFPDYNIRLVFLVKNMAELEKIMNNIEKICENKLSKKEILFNREIIKTERYTTVHSKKKKTKLNLILNEKEKKFIKELYKNPESSLIDLSSKTKFSIEGVRHKMKEFQNSGFIKSFNVNINKEKTGMNFWMQLLLNVNNLKNNLSKIENLIYSNVSYGRSRFVFGEWNIEMGVALTSHTQLITIISELENLLGNDLKECKAIFRSNRILAHRIPPAVFA